MYSLGEMKGPYEIIIRRMVETGSSINRTRDNGRSCSASSASTSGSMLGADDPLIWTRFCTTRYLVQNELKVAGGHPGAFVVLRAHSSTH